MTTVDQRVREAFVELADTLVDDFDIIDYLDRLAARCMLLLEVNACGILLVDHNGELNVVAASSEQTRLLELFQLQNLEGPCLDAFHNGQIVHCPDLTAGDPRWPRFSEAARATGFGGVYALPMLLRGTHLGALNLFTDTAQQLDPGSLELGQALAHAATIGIVHQRALARQEEVTGQLQTALNSRILIEQAKGFLADRLDITVDQAFDVLRTHARRNNHKLLRVAHGIVDGTITITAIDQ